MYQYNYKKERGKKILTLRSKIISKPALLQE